MAKRSPGSRRERGQHPRARPSGAGGPGTAARGARPRPACRVPGRPPLRLGTAPPEVASACEGSGTCDPWPWGARAACASLSVWGTARLRGAPWGSVMRGFGGCSEYWGAHSPGGGRLLVFPVPTGTCPAGWQTPLPVRCRAPAGSKLTGSGARGFAGLPWDAQPPGLWRGTRAPHAHGRWEWCGEAPCSLRACGRGHGTLPCSDRHVPQSGKQRGQGSRCFPRGQRGTLSP